MDLPPMPDEEQNAILKHYCLQLVFYLVCAILLVFICLVVLTHFL